jgi:glycosyltransferase involved in cell wall biosynthesis
VNILLVNKFFRRGAGAETVVFDTVDLLEAAGHTVVPFAMAHEANEHSSWNAFFSRRRDYWSGPWIARARDGMASIYSLDARRRVTELVRATRPDVAHLHNVYHQLTMSVVDALHAEGVPIVMTVHDYKPVCPNYQLLASDGPCKRCVAGSYINAITRRCINGSRAASVVAAAEASLNRLRGQYAKIDRFIAPSSFARDVLVEGGLPAARIEVVPNPVNAVHALSPGQRMMPTFAYAGRLAPEKGLSTLLDAVALVRRFNVVVDLYGAGPLEAPLRERVASEHLPVKLHGLVSKQVLKRALSEARAVLLPSIWFENCPMSLLEAGAEGTPAIASAIGGIPEVVLGGETGLLVPPGDARALAGAIDLLAGDAALAEELGRAAWRHVEAHHRPSAYLNQILDVYRRAGAAASRVSLALGGA